MSGLPAGWEPAPIGDLIATDGLLVDGDWVESKDQDPDGEVRLTQLADIGDGRWRNRSDRHLTAAAADRLRCTDLQVDDVLVARMPDPLGRACLFPGDPKRCVTVVDVAIIRPGRGSVDPRWLMYAINAPPARTAIESMQSGTTRKRISRKNLGTVELPVAPLAEQQRIVGAIEEAFSKLDAGEAGLRNVRLLLKRMRDAVLSAAVTGRLVPQDPADTPASELLAGLGVERLNPDGVPDLPDGWARARIGDVIGPAGLFVDGDWVESKDQDPEGEVRLTQLADIGDGCWRDRSNRSMTAANSERLGCTILVPGDVLVARMPDPLGRACQFPGDPRPCVTVVDVAIIRPSERGVDPAWLMWAINSGPVRAQIDSMKAGTTRKRISRKNLAAVKLDVPPPAEQARIVAEVERQLSDLRACEQSIEAGLERSAALRRAVLKAAFAGQLVPQDPTDEPASVLLERIRAEREAAPKAKKPRRPRRAAAP